MKKLIILVPILIVIIGIVMCMPKHFLSGTDWTVSDDTVHFGKDTFIYQDKYSEEHGAYKVYTHGPELWRVKNSLTSDQTLEQKGKEFVLIADLEIEAPPEDTATGQQTHFCYYGKYTKDRIVCMEPRGQVITLDRK